MRKFILKCSLFAVLAYVLLNLIAIFVNDQPSKNINDKFYWIQSIEDNHYDVAFVGSSRTDFMIDPATFDAATDTNSINIGVSGFTYLDIYFLTKQFLAKNQVDTVLLNVDYLSISNHFTCLFRDYLWTQHLDDPEIYDATHQQLGAFQALAYRYSPPIRHYEFGNEYRYYLFNDPPATSKFAESKGANMSDTDPFIGEPISGQMPVDTDSVYDLHKIIETCQQQGCEVILVRGPLRLSYIDANIDRSLTNAVIEEVANEYQLPFWDFQTLHQGNEDAMLYDTNHTNTAGSIAYTEALAERFNQWRNTQGPVNQ